MTNLVLYHMICSILLPRRGDQDEVSYLEAFLIDSILTGRQIHIGYLMMMHIISCCKSTTQVLPYDRFLTRMFKDARVDLSRETDFEVPTIYDTYDEQSLGWMKFEKASDGSWIRGAERPPAQSQKGFTYQFKHLQQRFERMEERMDQQQTTFEQLQQSIERIESHQESQHEEMMAYLRSVFPFPQP
uniref:Uncharacterized protein n=1 Tax=Vitis vinifera TaxID=29760 RepID=A5AX12_VITVI|nr:hypothetical protein VITISV_028406 [Vitis vinifera]